MAAQGQLLPLVTPGGLGLDLEAEASILPPEFAVLATNAIIDRSGRLSMRHGYTDETTTKIASTPAVETIFEYIQQDGTLILISAWNGDIGVGLTDPDGNSVEGAFNAADGHFLMCNFNDNVLAFQEAKRFGVKSTTGNFAEVEESGAGVAPSGGIATCAFGRVWCTETDGKTISYSGLLDETDWGPNTTAGSIDMSNVWTGGTDEITAITAFNGELVVFGRQHIIFWTDGTGSKLGLNPDNIYVSDVIEGTGCIQQLTVAHIGESDVLFLSPNGVQSLARLTTGRSNVVRTLTRGVRTLLREDMEAETEADIRGAYSPKYALYLLSFPSQNRTYCLHINRLYSDSHTGDALPAVTTWDLAPTAMHSRRDGSFLLGGAGELQTLEGFSDDAANINFTYESPWLDLGPDVASRLKMLKRVGAIIATPAAVTVNIQIFVDFGLSSTDTLSETLIADSTDEYNSASWETGEFGGGTSLHFIRVPARRKGQYFKIKVTASVNNRFALQQLNLFTKLGRMA